MYHGCKIVSMEIGDDDVIVDIINSKSISTIWTAVTWLVFKLERRTNKPTCDELDWHSRCCTNFKIFSIITVVITILQVIMILEILASTQSPIAFSLLAKIFNFGKYVRLTVCQFAIGLSVCLSVCPD